MITTIFPPAKSILLRQNHFKTLVYKRISFKAEKPTTPNEPSFMKPRLFLWQLKNALYGLGLVIGSVFMYGYLTDSRALFHKYVTIKVLQTFFEPETAHSISAFCLKNGIYPIEKSTSEKSQSEALSCKFKDFELNNPLGLAAGLDKQGEYLDSMFSLGFGFVEIGTVTLEPQEGNQKPRHFRLNLDEAVINRYGFNSDGSETILKRLKLRYWQKIKNINRDNLSNLKYPENKACFKDSLIGINIGKNRNSTNYLNDYYELAKKFANYCDYLVINVSSPNTPNLRELQNKQSLRKIINTVKEGIQNEANKPKIMFKISPDLSDNELKDIADLSLESNIDGVILSNTTLKRPISLETIKSNIDTVMQEGGLSGRPLKPIVVNQIRKFYKMTSGKVFIIGCGGISDYKDCIEYARAGASAVQIHSALSYKGPKLPVEIKSGLKKYMHQNKTTWSQLIGMDHTI